MKMYRPFNFAKHVITGVLFVSVAFSARADESLWSLVWASHDQAKSLSYSGLLITESGKHSQTSKLLHQATAGDEFEVLER
ncbi:MAG: hypothetical protein ACK5Q1_16850, partial [Limnobacter sp.]